MKILVVVGTSEFDLLIERMDSIAPKLQGEILMQIGLGKIEPKNAPFFRHAPSLEGHMAQSDLVVSHGGFGVMTEALHLGKKVVAVANPDLFNNHQIELLEKFSSEGYITWCKDLSGLEGAILEASRSTLRPYITPDCTIGARIREFLGAPTTRVPSPGG